jgi:cytochrome P450
MEPLSTRPKTHEATAADTWPFPRDTARPFLPPPRLSEFQQLDELTDIHMYDGTPATLATHFDDVREIIMSPDVSSDGSRTGYPYVSEASRFNRGKRATIDRLDDPEHKRQRSMLAGDFSIKRVRELRPFLDQYIAGLLDGLQAAGSSADLVTDFAELIPAAAIGRMLDLPEEDTDFFLDRVQRWMNDQNEPDDILLALNDITTYFESVVDERTGGSGEDLITRLIRDQVTPGHLSREQLLLTIHLLITAGFDTTAKTIALGTVALLDHETAWEELRADPSLVPGAVEEIIRYISAAHNSVLRLAQAPLPVGHQVIPAGRAIIASTLAANHDPRHYPDPDRIDIHRNARDHLAFGMGLHQCLGQSLARVELQAVFSVLPGRFPNLEVAIPRDELAWNSTAVIYGVDTLPVRW